VPHYLASGLALQYQMRYLADGLALQNLYDINSADSMSGVLARLNWEYKRFTFSRYFIFIVSFNLS
jgi:hypothetical protein